MRVPIRFYKNSVLGNVCSISGTLWWVVGIGIIFSESVLFGIITVVFGFGFLFLAEFIAEKDRISRIFANRELLNIIENSSVQAFVLYNKEPSKEMLKHIRKYNPYAADKISKMINKEIGLDELVADLRRNDEFQTERFCLRCGSRVEPQKMFCGNCGEKIRAETNAVQKKQKNSKGLMIGIIVVLHLTLFSVFSLMDSFETREKETVKGVLTSATYENEFIGIKYTAPSDWLLLTEEETAELMETDKWEMTSIDANGNVVSLMLDKLKVLNRFTSESDYLNSIKRAAEKEKPYGVAFSDIQAVTIGGETFSCTTDSDILSDVSIGFYCKKIDGYMVLIRIEYADKTSPKNEEILNHFSEYGGYEKSTGHISDYEEMDEFANVSEKKYKKGILTSTTYESEFIGIRYVSSANCTLATEDELLLKNPEGNWEMYSSCEDGSSCVVFVDELTEKDFSEKKYIEKKKEQMKNDPDVLYVFFEESEADILGEKYHSFGYAIMSDDGDEIASNQRLFVRKKGEYMIGFVIEISSSTNDLLSCFSKY